MMRAHIQQRCACNYACMLRLHGAVNRSPSCATQHMLSVPLQIMASDGVWDVMDGQEAVNRVMEVASEGKTAAQAAKMLVEVSAPRIGGRGAGCSSGAGAPCERVLGHQLL